MKFLPLVLVLLLGPLLGATFAGTPLSPGGHLALEDVAILVLKDGTELEGSVTTASIELETDFGTAKVLVSKIATIEFGDTDRVDTRGGTTLTGSVKTSTVRMRVDGKKTTVKLKTVARWVAVVDGMRQDAADFSGEWMTSFGPMTLTQTGRDVAGTYGYDKTRIEGTAKGNTLDVTYGSGGSATFDLWSDGEFITGDWKNGERDGRWGGYRRKPSQPDWKPGEIVEGQSESGMRYYVRVPESYDPATSYDAICILHGSNMSARDYVGTFPGAWPELASRYIIVGFDGEQMNGWSEQGSPTFNYTYINFGGDGVGPAYAHRQSPALVAEGIGELGGVLGIDRWFVGGHSQGGWLTYPIAMFYPDLVAGVFPMSGGMLIQCEPTRIDDLTEQRAVAFAPIHGTNDDVVAFSSGKAGVDSLLDGGFPTMRFFTDDRAGHMFAHLPVDDAIEWLDRMSSGDGGALAALAVEAAKDKRWRDVAAALQRASEVEPSAAQQAQLDAAAAKLDTAAKAVLKKLAPKVLANKNNGWMDDFLDYRDEFAFADASKEVMAAYTALRDKHQGPADDLFWKQRSEKDKDVQRELREEIVETYYASSWYRLVKGWL